MDFPKRVNCKRCGMAIHYGQSLRPDDQKAMREGFCGWGCKEVDEAIMDDIKHEAEKDLANGGYLHEPDNHIE